MMEQTTRLRSKVKGFTRFVKGWSHGEGVPVMQDVADRLDSFIVIAHESTLKAEVYPGTDGGAAILLYIDSPNKNLYAIQVCVRPDTHYDVSVARGQGRSAQMLVGGSNFNEADALQMVTSWIDTARSGRADKPKLVTIF